MDILNHSDHEEEQSRYASSSRPGSRFGARRLKRRSGSHQHLLLMDCVGGSEKGNGASEESVPLPEYERLSQSARLPDDPDPRNPPPPPETLVKQGASPPKPPPPPPPTQQQKPAAWRLIEYVRSRHRSGGAGSEGDSKGSDGEKEGSEDGGNEGKKGKNNKKRSSWLPDPDRRWPVQGFY
ncbi:uncharacterized protein LOC133915554 [Phragmites australis]|uniref:uncharacterized protein LOC133915554 n=1 Tax=Phragmites australis TaxID=29695 RepID=UPI002D79C430|nr:uncharacterized protein LOC133915554 [Phragmites australis]